MAQAWQGRSGESVQRHFHEAAWWLVPTQIWLASFFGSLCRWETVWWTYSLRSSLARPPSPILCWETILLWYTDTVPLWWVPRAPKESCGATHRQGSALERQRSFILLRCSSENTRRFSEMSCHHLKILPLKVQGEYRSIEASLHRGAWTDRSPRKKSNKLLALFPGSKADMSDNEVAMHRESLKRLQLLCARHASWNCCSACLSHWFASTCKYSLFLKSSWNFHRTCIHDQMICLHGQKI